VVPPLSPRVLIVSSIGSRYPPASPGRTSPTNFNGISGTGMTHHGVARRPCSPLGWQWRGPQDSARQPLTLFVRLILTTMSRLGYIQFDPLAQPIMSQSGRDGYFIRQFGPLLYKAGTIVYPKAIDFHNSSLAILVRFRAERVAESLTAARSLPQSGLVPS